MILTIYFMSGLWHL